MSTRRAGSIVPTLPPPSAEIRAEALARAERLARGLFPHQVEGVAFLLGRRRAVLADDMGLGKTRQSIVALTEAAPDGPWLIVSPASVKRNWAREILAARPDDRVHVVGPASPPAKGYNGWVVVNYDLLGKHLGDLVGHPWAGIVFDEAHYLKNHTSRRSKYARQLAAAAPDAVLHALTGTPLTNRPRDLFPLLQLIGHPMGRSFLSFAKRYCDAYHNGFGWVTDGASNLDELRVQLHGIMLRRTKDEVLDLPPKLRAWVPVPVPENTARTETRRVLERLIEGSLGRAAGKGRSEREPAGRKRNGRGNGAGQDRVRLLADVTKARVAIARAKVPTTVEFVDGMVEQGEKVVVFSSFDDPVQAIAEHFCERAVVLTGSTPGAERQAVVDRFQNDPDVRVFVANIVAGGVGITLTAARQVVFNDLDWVPANHWQAEDRAYRIGQTATVNVTYFTAEDTIDEFVASVLRAKAALIEAVVDGDGTAPPSTDLLTELETALRAISPGLASGGEVVDNDGDPVDRLLREVVAAVAEGEAASADPVKAALRVLPEEAIRALARVLSGPAPVRYRVTSSSKPGSFYILDVDGGDVTCTCAGFEYRGACRHARTLKAGLSGGAGLPAEFEPVPAG